MSQSANKQREMKTRRSKKAGALLLGALCAAQVASAHDVDSAFQMTVIKDAAYGGRVVSGHYDVAIEKITDGKIRPSQRFFASTNLCVAYTKSGDLDNARVACNEAVQFAPAETALIQDYMADINRRYQALALSNRGVLRALSGDESLALQDFEMAISLKGGLSAPERNLTHLRNRDAEASTALQAAR